jgi:hypothetical protein
VAFCYCVLETRTQVFLVEKHLSSSGIHCELKHISQNLTKDLCNLAIKFNDYNLKEVSDILERFNFPEYKIIP